ncbi:hypothetical protein D9758_003636 [Tetrapyrgos nigripes]|uniref:Telomerase reverse transcriptase n=1 Tax=Tetrapyrgos nigripes TaxID=182062 RepID=A0A8H5GMD0_9AGAR|nr:hypothetical protein D9758_003636 [Tetrapyrgos nigripes]
MALDDCSPVLSILKQYFPMVKSLRQHLQDILEPGQKSFGWLQGQADKSPLTSPWRICIIARSQEMLIFTPKRKKANNIITHGYGEAFRNGDTPLTRRGIVNYFVNTIVTALQGPQWELLLQRIGTTAMIHLLTETNIFISLPNNSLCQMTGEPLNLKKAPTNSLVNSETRSSRKRRMLDGDENERPFKRPKMQAVVKTSAGSTKLTVRSPIDAAFPRQRLFYAKPAFVPHTNRILVGLPSKHILNRQRPSYEVQGQKPDICFEDTRLHSQQARHLSKYVFPSQYGLQSPFSYHHYATPDFSDREDEITRHGVCKTPKRLRETLPLLEKLLWKHGKCKYKLLRDRACPSKLAENHTLLDSSVILQLISENSSEPLLQTQQPVGEISLDSAGNSILGHFSTQTKNKPRFAEFCFHVNEVYRYVVLVTNAVIPKRFWGSEANFKLICKHIKLFISCRRFETLTLHTVLQGFSTSACEWLMPPGDGNKQHRVNASDQLKRRELLEDFIYWFFDSFVLALLRTTFYVTESSAFRNQVLYFRMDDWQTLCAPLVNKLTLETFQKIPESDTEELLRQRKLGFSFVRLLPKETGVRPIVNLKRKQSSKTGDASGGPAINQILQAALQILNYEKERQPHLLGASVFGPSDVYAGLKKLKANLPRSNGKLPKLYFVKVDVQACFDTIEQTKLLEILRQLISEDNYMIQKYGQMSTGFDKTHRRFARRAVPEGMALVLRAVLLLTGSLSDEHPDFIQYAKDLAGCIRNTIFIDQVIYPVSKKQEILDLLEMHVTENIVKIGKDYYRQTVGIPQGSVLSTILCCFFYGDMEKRFKHFIDDPQSLLLRHTDDYLYVTTNRLKASGFLHTMMEGHPEYGCFISRQKTLVNFQYDQNIEIVEHDANAVDLAFPWCGYLIDVHDLSVSGDYTRYHGFHLSDTLTIARGRNLGSAFRHKMLRQAKTRSHIIYTDNRLNSKHVVHSNIYQNFLLSAMKMYVYVRDWGLSTKSNERFILGITKQMICCCVVTVRNSGSSKLARDHKGQVSVQQQDITWLATHAFHTIFSRTPHRYTLFLRHMATELSRPRHWRRAERFRKVVKDSSNALAHIIF